MTCLVLNLSQSLNVQSVHKRAEGQHLTFTSDTRHMFEDHSHGRSVQCTTTLALLPPHVSSSPQRLGCLHSLTHTAGHVHHRIASKSRRVCSYLCSSQKPRVREIGLAIVSLWMQLSSLSLSQRRCLTYSSDSTCRASWQWAHATF